MPENRTERNLPVARSEHSAITVEGHSDRCWAEWFDDWVLAYTDAGETVLSGSVADQAALHGLLMRIRDLNMTLIAVERSAHHGA
jgi:hypothetical protein